MGGVRPDSHFTAGAAHTARPSPDLTCRPPSDPAAPRRRPHTPRRHSPGRGLHSLAAAHSRVPPAADPASGSHTPHPGPAPGRAGPRLGPPRPAPPPAAAPSTAGATSVKGGCPLPAREGLQEG
nr:basic proline-rich protein [Oryctolagus cuniculus]